MLYIGDESGSLASENIETPNNLIDKTNEFNNF